MDNNNIKTLGNSRIPSYVPIYDMLYSDIINGVYESGSQLPGEAFLAEKYGVSRNTLRQALTVLVEDGLITKVQGKGTFITYDQDKTSTMEAMFNPMITCCKNQVEDVDTYYNFGPATEVGQRKLGLRPSEIVLASNNVYYSKQKPVGHSFMQIPVKYIDELNVDLNQEEEVSELINKRIFEMAASVQMSIKLVYAEENVTSFLKIPNETPIIFIEEILYNKDNAAIVRCKFYFIPEEYDIVFRD